MKISLIQPKIIRGNIDYNLKKIQQLINISKGNLLILAEYVLTGSLVLDNKVNVQDWAEKSEQAKKEFKIPNNKILIINSLKQIEKRLYNICELIPTDKYQIKVYPDDTEKNNGILPGEKHEIFDLFGRKFKIMICMDFKYADTIPSEKIDFFIWIYHFSEENYPRMLSMLKEFVKKRKIPILASSLVSDKNNGFSTYIDQHKIISLSNYEGILEIDL